MLSLQLAGIELLDRHRELLAHRMQRRGLTDPHGVTGLLDAVEHGDPVARRKLLGMLTTNFTGFFRHPQHFKTVTAHALQSAQSNGQARCWSAAAASGEEPYTLAIALIEAFGRDDPPVSILATDIDVDALTVAAGGTYSDRALSSLESARRDRFFQRIAAGWWSVIPAVRHLVEFRPLNLVAENWTVTGPFDAILCRNVLMYLESGRRAETIRRFALMLPPGGLLVLDPSEHLGRKEHRFSSGAGGVYLRLKDKPPIAPHLPGALLPEPLGSSL